MRQRLALIAIIAAEIAMLVLIAREILDRADRAE